MLGVSSALRSTCLPIFFGKFSFLLRGMDDGVAVTEGSSEFDSRETRNVMQRRQKEKRGSRRECVCMCVMKMRSKIWENEESNTYPPHSFKHTHTYRRTQLSIYLSTALFNIPSYRILVPLTLLQFTFISQSSNQSLTYFDDFPSLSYA